jgi:hypothetical protein
MTGYARLRISLALPLFDHFADAAKHAIALEASVLQVDLNTSLQTPDFEHCEQPT